LNLHWSRLNFSKYAAQVALAVVVALTTIVKNVRIMSQAKSVSSTQYHQAVLMNSAACVALKLLEHHAINAFQSAFLKFMCFLEI
jgi:hypothetical protein